MRKTLVGFVHLLFLFIYILLPKWKCFFYFFTFFKFLFTYFSRLRKRCQDEIQSNNKKAPELLELSQAGKAANFLSCPAFKRFGHSDRRALWPLLPCNLQPKENLRICHLQDFTSLSALQFRLAFNSSD